jgi:hypothetical protein
VLPSWAQRRIFVVPESDVILSAAKDLRRPDREPSIETPKILRLTAQDDKCLTAQDDKCLTAQDDKVPGS